MEKEPTFEQLPKAVMRLSEKINNIERLLLDKSNDNQPESDQLLTIQQAGELIKLSVPTLYGYVSRNEIPFSKRPNSKRLWFSKLDLTNWIKEGRKKSIGEINAEANTYVKMKGAKAL